MNPAPFERFDLRLIAPQPWKNGAGQTREIAFGPASDGGAVGPSDAASAADFDWRFSLADVDRDAPFSAFPGLDRCITLWQGAGMRLHSHDGRIDHALTTRLVPFDFPGDVALNATLVAGACTDFNVMTRRGRLHSDVRVHRSAVELADADVTLLLCADGDWLIGTETLAPMQAMLWRGPHRGATARPAGASAALLHVRLCHDHAP